MSLKISLSKKEFKINDVAVEFPVEIAVLKTILGEARLKKSEHNQIYTWDNHGLIAFSKDASGLKYSQRFSYSCSPTGFSFS